MKNAPWNFPEHFAFLDAEAKRASLGANDDLVPSGKTDERGRSIAGWIVERGPNDFTIVFIQAEDGFAIAGPALDDELGAQDNGRGRHSISRHAGMMFDHYIF